MNRRAEDPAADSRPDLTSADLARFDMIGLIARKRDGNELTTAQIQQLIRAYMADEVADEQMSALLMAGVIRGFSDAEAVALTEALIASGDTVDLDGLTGPTVDKHSTGGVGDTTTLVVAPLVAACGLQVAKLSGRGLGHTGGTLDKLAAIPGFRVDLTPEQMRAQVEDIGVAVAAATQDLVPADKRLYALRDVTATVSSQALIASSVMSKKIAGGARNVVLDVKTGSGAFMESLEDATELARLCVEIGEAHGLRTAALVTDMSQPLSDAVGNAIEVAHAIDVLRGDRAGRLLEVSIELSRSLLELTGRDPEAAAAEVRDALESGAALERFRDLVVAQGGDPTVADRPWEVLPQAPVTAQWTPDAGVVVAMDGRRIGELASLLGAGRARKEDDIDPAVGLEVLVRIGDDVSAAPEGCAVRVHARTAAAATEVLDLLPEAITLVTDGREVMRPALVQRRIGLSDRRDDPGDSDDRRGHAG